MGAVTMRAVSQNADDTRRFDFYIDALLACPCSLLLLVVCDASGRAR